MYLIYQLVRLRCRFLHEIYTCTYVHLRMLPRMYVLLSLYIHKSSFKRCICLDVPHEQTFGVDRNFFTHGSWNVCIHILAESAGFNCKKFNLIISLCKFVRKFNYARNTKNNKINLSEKSLEFPAYFLKNCFFIENLF